MNDAALAEVLTQFARLLVNDYEISDALHDLIDGVIEVLGIAGAGVSLAQGGRITVATATPQPVAVLEHLQDQTQMGPCVEAHRSGQVVLVPDVTQERSRWPALGEAVAETGMVAVAGIPMRLDGTNLGALNLYDDSRHDWSHEEVDVARLLADLATGYIANASKLHKAIRTAEQLQVALDSRVIIEQAKGMIAANRHVSVDEAFMVLRKHANDHNAGLHATAEAVVRLGLRP